MIGNFGRQSVVVASPVRVICVALATSDPRRCAPRGPQIHVLSSPCLEDLTVDEVFIQVTGCWEQLRLPSQGPTIISACA